ncbi:MAG: hypothetical protein ACRBI6_12545 [Acidimicrobiales bacterium]
MTFLPPMPNTFVIGALGADSQALGAALAAHPEVFCPEIAAPEFHSLDLPCLSAATGVNDDDAYLDLFADAAPHHRVVLDASPSYLASSIAVERTEAATAREARYVVVVRDPADLVAAHHATLVAAGFDDVDDLERAWQLEADRLAGRVSLPGGCAQPELLAYRSLATLGEQIERLLARVPHGRVFVVDHDELVDRPQALLTELVAWLGLSPADLRIGALADTPSDGATESFKAVIRHELRRDVDYLALLTGLDLSAWQRRPSTELIIDLRDPVGTGGATGPDDGSSPDGRHRPLRRRPDGR